MTTSVAVPGAVDVAPTVSESRGEASAALYPIALLIDELRSEDVDLRINAMNQLDHIACALGPVRTREELLPFLTELAMVDDVASDTVDETRVLTAMARVLNADFMQWIGGPQYGQCLLRPLEELANSDDEPRREEAVKSLITIAKALPLSTLEAYYIPMLRNMAASDWFCQRAVAVALLPAVVSRLCARKKGSGGDPPLAVELVNTIFSALGADDSPMVRRAVFQVLGDIAAATFPVNDSVKAKLLELFKSLARDEQESVRILTVPVCIQLAKCLSSQPYEIVKDLLPSIHSCGEDQHSWRVRYMVADKIEDILEAVPEKVRMQIFPLFMRLLSDPEPEVRCVSCDRLSLVVKYKADQEMMEDLTAPFAKLLHDPSDAVRSSFGASLMKVAAVVGQDLTVEYLTKHILAVMRDQSTNVRLAVVENLGELNTVVSLDHISKSLLPTIIDLASDRQWRVRMAILEQTPKLATILSPKTFTTELLATVMRWLCDPVYSVRVAATENLANLSVAMGTSWAIDNIIPHLQELSKNSNYLYRMTALMGVVSMANVLDEKACAEYLMPLPRSLVQDSVANVRFNVAKTLKSISSRVSRRTLQHEIIPILQKLAQRDSDQDVRFFSGHALEDLRNTKTG
ncbi:hypothetical protein FOZ60_000194 [Perkinsus olseni]|uniref:Uncharacterized protein n=4 Tax=Perkinsus olseni TaxID=32597 RepID=A0A7J6PL61_PEROL|nr:hypothetical protein FOZ60_000194 [Perkinsus olseni]